MLPSRFRLIESTDFFQYWRFQPKVEARSISLEDLQQQHGIALCWLLKMCLLMLGMPADQKQNQIPTHIIKLENRLTPPLRPMHDWKMHANLLLCF